MRSLQSQIRWCWRAQWVLGVGIGMCALGFYAAGHRPAVVRLNDLRMQIDSKQRELDQNQTRARDLPILALEVQQLESRVHAYDRQFPGQPELGQFIRDITQIIQQHALEEWKYQPGLPRKGGAIYELPIQMHFQGDFLSVASFLRQVEDMQRLTRIRKMSMRQRDGGKGVVEVDLSLSIYFSET